MNNCEAGDIAVITWDEAPVFSNVGKLVWVIEPGLDDPKWGTCWYIMPVDYEDDHLFIEETEEERIKPNHPGQLGIKHPDAWLLPIRVTEKRREEWFERTSEQWRNHFSATDDSCTEEGCS